jgi:putative tryptophan/tyrosine transport system substrate-binding protein
MKFQLKLLSFILPALLFGFGVAEAQHPTKIPRIGYVSGTGSVSNPGPYVEALRQGLRDLSYTEGKDFVIEFRGAEGKPERVPSIVADLIQLKVDILILPTISTLRAAKQATNTIPVIMVTQADPVALGLIDSLAHPGGNFTGITTLQRDLGGKRLELLKETVPKTSKIGILLATDEPVALIGFKDYEAAAHTLKLQIRSLGVRSSNPDLDGTFREANKERVNAIMTMSSNLLFRNAKKIAELAIKSRLPSMYEGGTWVESGGLISYSANDLELFRRAATYVDKIVKGAKPGDLPVEQPTKFELLINLKTAKQIGLTIPPNVLARADRVIK